MTVVMKIDLAGPRRRGLALGLNEAADYRGVAGAAFASGILAASYAPRTVVWVGAGLLSVAGLLISIVAVHDTGAHVAHEQEAHGDQARDRDGLRNAFCAGEREEPAGQFATGWLADHVGRKPLISSGMLVRAAALGVLFAGGAFAPSLG